MLPEPISPELALVDPELRRRALGLLADPPPRPAGAPAPADARLGPGAPRGDAPPRPEARGFALGRALELAFAVLVSSSAIVGVVVAGAALGQLLF